MPIDTNVTITPENLVNYYKEFVSDVINADVAWYTGNKPFAEFPDADLGGAVGGVPPTIEGTDIAVAGNLIDASDIFDVVVAETANYTSIRNLRAIRTMGGVGTTFDETRKAYMSGLHTIAMPSVSAGDVITDNTITAVGLETLFTSLKDAHASLSTVTIEVSVCHSSCHSSCHGSRGRR